MAIQRTSLNVSLAPALETFIAERVGSNRYQTASEVVRARLLVLEQTGAVGTLMTAASRRSKTATKRA